MPGLLAVLAHPDDEFFCAGLLAAAASRGAPVHLAFWTRGEGGGSPRRRFFWRCLPRCWHYRSAEARRSAAALGACSVTFLGAADPAPRDGLRAPAGDPAQWEKKLAALLARLRPEAVVSHGTGGEYGHPAHLDLHAMVRAAVERVPGTALITFAAPWPGAPAALFWNRDDPADYVIDAGPFRRQKIAVARAHRSQKGALESLVEGTGFSLGRLLRASRLEGYRFHGGVAERERAQALVRFWAGEDVRSAPPEGARRAARV